MTQNFEGEAYKARRSLYRHEMMEHAGSIPWLINPRRIPRAAVKYNNPPHPNPYLRLGSWMLEGLIEWSGRVHTGLPYQETFEKYRLTERDRLRTFMLISQEARTAFHPGIRAMAEIQAVAQDVEIRDQVDPTQWPEVAHKSRKFGAQIARDGTFVQLLIRAYLEEGAFVGLMDAAKLKLDADTGITTVTPLEYMIDVTKEALKRNLPQTRTSHTCVALNAPVPELNDMSMFDAVWGAYGVAAQRHIHPIYRHLAQNLDVPGQMAPDANIEAHIDMLARALAST